MVCRKKLFDGPPPYSASADVETLREIFEKVLDSYELIATFDDCMKRFTQRADQLKEKMNFRL